MAARNSLDTGSGKDSKEKAIKTARAVLDGKMGIIEGARLLSTLAPDLVPDWKVDPDFLVLAVDDIELHDYFLPFLGFSTWATLTFLDLIALRIVT